MRLFTVCLVVLGISLAPVGVSAQTEDLSAHQVREALDDAIHFLKQQQRKDGSWPDWIKQSGGVASLCTLALLEAGVPVEDPAIQRALTYLRKLRPEEINATYSTSLQTMVFAKAEPFRDLAALDRNVRWLERTQIQDGMTKGGWSYPGLSADNSNSQFALLALHEAERAGVKVDARVWRLAKAYWEDCQNPDGSWGYRKGMPGTGSMTCAGITSLVIANDMVHQSNAQVVGNRIQCCQEMAADSDDRVVRALQWLGNNFSVSRNPGGSAQAWLLYYLYGLERVGRMTAHRFIGGHDWYREGAHHLLHEMKSAVAASGGWQGKGYEEKDKNVATSFAMLFLAKGRRPVLMSKVKFHSGDDWNQHRSDVGNLTRFVESRWKRDLTWQIVDLEAASVDDLLQSPVLYFTGRSDLLPHAEADREELARKLRDYVDRGGFLFAEADCNGPGFDQGFRALMKRVFPEKEYSLQLLPPEHPIWRAEEKVDPQHLRPLWGIEFGCRTSVVYIPPDPESLRPSLSCLWELSRSGRDRDYSEPVKAQLRAGLAVGINVLAYATNRELRPKDMIPAKVVREETQDPSTRGRIYIANLRHPGGCNAAPRALVNLMETASQELKMRTGAEAREVGLTDEALFDYHLVFMQGRSMFRLTDGERKQLRTYIERGGMLFANSICASKTFTESFRREMATIFPDKPLEPIPANDPLLTPAYGGFDLSTVTRRDPQRATGNEPLRDVLRKVPPELDGIKFGDRYGVVFSRHDLSCALEKQNSLECQGYIREDAGRIGLNVLLYSLQQ
jgi:hypothetical protein